MGAAGQLPTKEIGDFAKLAAKAKIIADRGAWQRIHVERLVRAGAKEEDIVCEIGDVKTEIRWRGRKVFEWAMSPSMPI